MERFHIFLGFLYRFVVLAMPRLREILLKSRSRLTMMYKVESVCRRQGMGVTYLIFNFFFNFFSISFRSFSGMGDWFLLYQLGKNIDPLIFKEFIGELYERVEQTAEMQ